MGIIGKINQDNIEFIRLRYFINVLNFSVSSAGFSGFYVLPELLDKGLSLHYRESGHLYDQRELKGYNEGVKRALSQVSNNLFDTDEPVSKIYQNALVKNQNNAVLSLWNLYVKRSDVKKSYYSAYGEKRFPWALVFEPLTNKEWAWFPDVAPIDVKQIQVIQTYIPIPDTTMPVVLEDANTVSQVQISVQPRRRLIPMERATTEGLVLIYDLCKHYNVMYLDDLKGVHAWGKIVSGEFTSAPIKSITTQSITFLSGNKLLKGDFLEKYRNRFKAI
ncbi:MAG: hypothetical protein ACXW1W_08075 [Methylococcaceae bacterium]